MHRSDPNDRAALGRVEFTSLLAMSMAAVGAVLGAFLDRAFDGTMRPLAYGFLGYGLVALALVLWGERGRLFGPLADPVAVAEAG